MNKSYKKRLNNLSTQELEEIPEIEGLDQILELPQPLREISLVKAICDAHKKSKKTKTTPAKVPTSKVIPARAFTKPAALEVWSETAGKGHLLNNSN